MQKMSRLPYLGELAASFVEAKQTEGWCRLAAEAKRRLRVFTLLHTSASTRRADRNGCRIKPYCDDVVNGKEQRTGATARQPTSVVKADIKLLSLRSEAYAAGVI